MNIIILAAGRGERLMPLTQNTPKPLLDMGNGNTLLEEQIHRIRESGVIDRVVVVIGYLAEQVEAKIKSYSSGGLDIRTVYNPFYEVSNNLMSLWLAKHEMRDEDFMVTNGDNLFTPDVLLDMSNQCAQGIHLAVNSKASFDYDDMKVTLQDGLVSRVHKEIPDDQASAESPGLSLVRGARARSFFLSNLEALARDKQHLNSFWLEVYNLLYERGIPVHPWEFDGKSKWREVDFHLDVTAIRSLIRERVA